MEKPRSAGREKLRARQPPCVQGELPKGSESGNPHTIVTHNGRFHCDDAMAVSMLQMLPEYADAVVIRTRDPAIIEKGSVVVDVGGVYDPTTLRFDHHQRGFADFFDPDLSQVTKMSSAGMVFKHFGDRLLREVFHVPDEYVPLIRRQLYRNLLESVDAADNGVNAFPPGVEPLYSSMTNLGCRVARLNEEWNEWTGDSVAAGDFAKAVEIAGQEFLDHLVMARDVWLPVRDMVYEAFAKRFETHSSGRVLEFETGCPFLDHLYDVEEEKGISRASKGGPDGEDVTKTNEILLTFYPNTADKSSWRVGTIRKSAKLFGERLPLPERFRGKEGPPGITFVHHSGFLAGGNSREACLDLINLTLREAGICQ